MTILKYIIGTEKINIIEKFVKKVKYLFYL